jgi:hypothetical protein
LINILREMIGRAVRGCGRRFWPRHYCAHGFGAIGKHCNLRAVSPMPPPYPVLLFTGQRIIDEAHQITGKVVDRISHATLASLTAKPVDDIVQALYHEHYIHLPVLDRNGAEHEDGGKLLVLAGAVCFATATVATKRAALPIGV